MSREIDERVVAMYFDNSNFERNANKTIKTLDELKQSCNMQGIEKGFQAFEEAGKKLNLDKLNESTKKLKTSFEGLGTALKKSLNVIMSPLDKLHDKLKKLEGYITKVAGINIADSIVNNIENAFRSLTIAPVSAGWSQYENTMDSVKTIMSSTGASLEEVNFQLAHMTEYANQTIYSLNDMTSNLGKFTNNGVKLEDATNAMIGLANATADAGQGASQASMAMYNVSQAIGVGKMTTIDWKSLENANIATVKLKQTFIDAAVAEGKLEKRVTKDAQTGKEVVEYWTKAENGMKATQVTVENFRETLSKGWLDKNSMMKTFAIYSGELSIDEIAALGFSREESARLYEIGQEAKAAATEVRTFHKMMDALKESVQSSWATSFQYIFGDMEEGTNLWTRLNEKIDAVLSKGAEHRNNILMSWRGLMKDENGNVRRIEDIYKERVNMLDYDLEHGYIDLDTYNARMAELNATLGNKDLWVDYREILMNALLGEYDENGIQISEGLVDSLIHLGGAIKSAWTNIFGEFNADTLKRITQGISDFVGKFKEWLGSADDAESRLSKIRRIFEGIFSVIKVIYNIIKTAVLFIWNMVKPLIDPILDIFAKIGDMLNLKNITNVGDMIRTLSERFKNFWNTLKELGFSGVMIKIGDWFKDLWEKIKSGVREFLVDNGLEGVVTWFEGVGAKIEEGYNIVKNWWDDPNNGIANFFRGIYNTIIGWFTPENEGEDLPIVIFFKNIASWLEKAWNDAKTALSTWLQTSGVGKFFTDLWNSIVGLFEPQFDGAYYDSTGRHEFHKASPIVQFFYDIGDAIKGAYDWLVGLSIWDDIGKFFSDIWNSVTGLFKPKEKLVDVFYDGKGRHEVTETIEAPIVSFFKGIYEGLKNIWDQITKWFENSGVGQFFSDAWAWIVSLFQPVTLDDGTVQSAPIVKFFQDILSWIGRTWEDLKTFIKSVDDNLGISRFFADAWGWLMDLLGIGGKSQEKQVLPGGPSYSTDMVASLGITGGAGGGGSKGKDIETIDDIDDELREKSPIIDFFVRIYQALEAAWNAVTGWEGWAAIGQFFSETWTWLTNLFTSKEVVEDEETGHIEEKKSLIESIGAFLKTITEAIAQAIKDIGSSAEAQAIAKTFEGILTVVGNILEIAITFLTHLTNSILGKEDGLNDAEKVTLIIGGLAFIISQIIEIYKLKKLSTIATAGGIMTNIGGQILQVAAGIALIALAIRYLGTIPTEELIKGGIAIAVIGGVLALVLTKLTNVIGAAGMNKEPEKAWERVVGKLISTLGMVGMLWIVMDKLPALIEVMSEAKKYSGFEGSDLFDALKGVFLLIGGLMLALGVTQRIAPDGLSIGATLKTTLSAMLALVAVIAGLGLVAAAMVEILEAVSVIDVKDKNGKLRDPDTIRSELEPILTLYSIIGEMFYSLIAGMLGIKTDEQKIREAGELSSIMAQMAESFDMEKVSGVIRIASMISAVSDTAKGIDTGKLGNLAEYMRDIGNALNEFAWVALGLYGDEDGFIGIAKLFQKGPDAMEKANEAVDLITSILGMFEPLSAFNSEGDFNGIMRAFTEKFGNTEATAAFIDAMNNILKEMQRLDGGEGINFDGIGIVEKLYESIQTALDDPKAPKFDATSIVDAILLAIGLGDLSIQAAVHDMVQNGLNLLAFKPLDGSQATAQYNADDLLGGMMGGQSWDDLLTSYLPTGEAIDQATSKMEKEIKESMNGVNDTYDELNDKYSNGAAINVMGVSFDEEFWGNLQTEMETLQTELDANSDYQLKLRPVINMEGFGDEIGKLRAFFNGEVPLSINAVVNLGETALPIDDTKIVNEMQVIRGEIVANRGSMEREIRDVNDKLGYKIESLASHIDNIKLQLSTGALVGGIVSGVDNALYNRNWHSEMTGVSD